MMNFSQLAAFGAVEITFTVIGGVALIALILFLIVVPVKAYFTALIAKAHISMAKLTSLKNCKVDPMSLVEANILAKRLGVNIKINEIESVLLAGGNVKDMLQAMALAKDASIPCPFSLASALELKTKNSLEIVKSAIESVSENISQIKAITKDNIELVVDVNLTLKIQLPKYLYGLATDKIKAFVTEHAIKKIPLYSKEQLMSNPQLILEGLDNAQAAAGSAYLLVESRVSNISIGRNIAMEMEVKRAEKERVFAQMQADRVKNSEEMKEIRARVKTEETKTSLLEAESQVPLAISQAIKEGRFSVMDYYKLMNLQADTALRRSIVSGKEENVDDDSDDDLFGDDE